MDVALHVTMTADILGRSRFAVSPVLEVVDTVRRRDRHPAPHARAWYVRAREGVPPRLLGLLEALVPADHDYTPDFLTPVPDPGVSVAAQLDAIAATPPPVVEHHLDVGLRGRTVRPEVAELFGSAAAYETWRRAPPEVLAGLIERGPATLAAVAAEAVGAFFEVAIREDWPSVADVLDADIRSRGDVLTRHGAVAMLDRLGPGIGWRTTGVSLERTYDGVIDWADDGLLLVPSTSHVGAAQIAAERPQTPMVTYRADGIARLWDRPAPAVGAPVAHLLGETRAALLGALADPRSTGELARELHLSEPTVSYHLQILLAAGLLVRRRRGRQVLYQHTALGTSLLAGEAPPTN